MRLIYQRWHESQIARRQRAELQTFGARTIADVAFADEPIQLADAHRQLNLDSTDADVWLMSSGIPAARAYCELYVGRSFATRTIELSSNRFPSVTVDRAAGPFIALPSGPVQSVTSVTYKSADEDSTGAHVVTSFEDSFGDLLCELDQYVTPNRLVLSFGQSWPAALDSVNSVKVRYVTGYVAEADTPGNLVLPSVARQAILLMLGHLFENREAVTANAMVELPLGVQSLLELVPDRERLGMA